MSRSTLALLLLSAGCEPMEPSGEIFAPAPVSPPAAPSPAAAAPGGGGELAFPTDEPLKLSSEQMAKNEAEVSLGAAAGVDVDALPGEPAPRPAAPAAAPAPAATGLPPVSAWPVRLVSTIAQAQPPRAVLGLPDGREQVVAPGSMLAELGIVVMTITQDRVQLARVQPAGDHAAIETIEVSAQYPAASAKP